MTISNENQLLLYFVQKNITEGKYDQINKILDLPMNWEEVLKSASWYRILPLLYHHLNRIRDIHGIPKDIMVKLKKIYLKNVTRNMYMYEEVNRISEVFNDQGLEIIFLKGIALDKTVYGNIGLRPMSDIDFLIKIDKLPRAEDIMLSKLGYVHSGNRPAAWYRENHQEISYTSLSKKIHVDMHWHISNNTHPSRIRIIESDIIKKWWKSAKTFEPYGRNIFILSPEDLISHLCLHFLKHLFISHNGGFSSKGAFMQICDIFQAIKFYENKINWLTFASTSEEYGINNNIYTALVIVNEFIGEDGRTTMRNVLNGFKSEKVDKEIVRIINSKILIREEELSIVPNPVIKAKIADSFYTKVKLLTGYLFPKPIIISKRYNIHLSSKKLYLYYLIHPLNLLFKYRGVIFETTRVKEDVILNRWMDTRN